MTWWIELYVRKIQSAPTNLTIFSVLNKIVRIVKFWLNVKWSIIPLGVSNWLWEKDIFCQPFYSILYHHHSLQHITHVSHNNKVSTMIMVLLLRKNGLICLSSHLFTPVCHLHPHQHHKKPTVLHVIVPVHDIMLLDGEADPNMNADEAEN